MRVYEIIVEGGWASTKTQGTKITPQTIADAMPVLYSFQDALNRSLKSEGLPEIKIGDPVGSGTYYKRDLKQNPDKEYGDIDVEFIMPRIEGQSSNHTQKAYFDAVSEFCRLNANFETDNGKNVIFKVDAGYIQVDLVAVFSDRVAVSKILGPEHGTKGVLSASIYSALAEALNLSISSEGVQAKVIDGKPVSFRKGKGTKLVQVSDNPDHWAADIAKFYGVSEQNFHRLLMQHPGKTGEVKIEHIIKSIAGIALTLDANNKLPAPYEKWQDLTQAIKEIYLNKINAVVNSSKFDKAETPAAKKKAAETKKLLSSRSAEIANMFPT
jgi:hypothetical protein